MKRSIFWLLVSIVVLIGFSNCTRVRPGEVGIKVNNFGNEKGVDNVTECTGRVWYVPWKHDIYKWPTYVQEAVYSNRSDEGKNTNTELSVSTNEGLVSSLDVAINFSVDPDKAIPIFVKYRKDLDNLINTKFRNLFKSGFNEAASEYSAEELFEKRMEFQNKADSIIRQIMEPEGILIDKVMILNDIRPPQSVRDAIESKVEARQLAQQKERELQQVQADSAKTVTKANADAAAMRIQAEAERYAYEQKQKALTPLLVQQQFLEKWDGTLPIYGEVPTLFKQVANSK